MLLMLLALKQRELLGVSMHGLLQPPLGYE